MDHSPPAPSNSNGSAFRVSVEPALWALFPDAIIGTIVVRGIDNQRNVDACRTRLDAATDKATSWVGDQDIATLPDVVAWRSAYRAFGAKPSKYRSSIENLLRSARAGTVPSINPLVDLYNAVSLDSRLPCGGEDLDAIAGNLVLTRANGDEAFTPLGSSEISFPQPGEVIYRDDLGTICRNWNWRESDRTKLRATTRAAVLCIEALSSTPRGVVHDACTDLASLVIRELGGTADIRILDRTTSTASFPSGT